MESIMQIFRTPVKQSDLVLYPGEPEIHLRVAHREFCSECGDEVVMQIMKNTGICSEICRKHRDGEVTTLEWSEKKVGF